MVCLVARADVQKTYKKLALQCHPDKVGHDPVLVDKFQNITTAYQVLSDKNATKAYWDMYKIRSYLFQHAWQPGMPLMPFYIFHIKKRDERGFQQERLITLDIGEGYMQNWKKDQPHRKIPLNAIREVRTGRARRWVGCAAGLGRGAGLGARRADRSCGASDAGVHTCIGPASHLARCR